MNATTDTRWFSARLPDRDLVRKGYFTFTMERIGALMDGLAPGEEITLTIRRDHDNS